MGRFHLLAGLAVVLIPVILPDRSHPVAVAPAPARAAVPAAAPPPATLSEAFLRVSERVALPFETEERCLAQAVYFEARSEPAEGQLAVAQVVLNRVASPFWPDSICAVVFQGEHRRHRCQFSFACDGLSDNPKNPVAWRRAKAVAAVALEAHWHDLAHDATHYHADYVDPWWRGAMDTTARYGRHIFYRDHRQAAVHRTEMPLAVGGN